MPIPIIVKSDPDLGLCCALDRFLDYEEANGRKIDTFYIKDATDAVREFRSHPDIPLVLLDRNSQKIYDTLLIEGYKGAFLVYAPSSANLSGVDLVPMLDPEIAPRHQYTIFKQALQKGLESIN